MLTLGRYGNLATQNLPKLARLIRLVNEKSALTNPINVEIAEVEEENADELVRLFKSLLKLHQTQCIDRTDAISEARESVRSTHIGRRTSLEYTKP